MSESNEFNIISALTELKKELVVLRDGARSKIKELESLKNVAVELGMKDAAEILDCQIKEIENVLDDFRSILFIKVNNLCTEIESVQDIENLRMRESIMSKISTMSEYLEDLSSSYDEKCADFESLRESWIKITK